jgi:hypothetical protein
MKRELQHSTQQQIQNYSGSTESDDDHDDDVLQSMMMVVLIIEKLRISDLHALCRKASKNLSNTVITLSKCYDELTKHIFRS